MAGIKSSGEYCLEFLLNLVNFKVFRVAGMGKICCLLMSIGFINETNWNVSALPLWNQLNYDNIFSEDIICCNITL